jgi:hypothetical protein
MRKHTGSTIDFINRPLTREATESSLNIIWIDARLNNILAIGTNAGLRQMWRKKPQSD